MRSDVITELKELRLRGMVGAWEDLTAKGDTGIVSGWRTHLDATVATTVGQSAVTPGLVASDEAVILKSDCSCGWADAAAHPSSRHTGHAH